MSFATLPLNWVNAIFGAARCVQKQLEDRQAREQQLCEENQRLREEVETLQQTAAYNPFTDPAKVEQYAAMVQAEGVSLPVAQRLLKILQANGHRR